MCAALKLSPKQFERKEREDPLFRELVEAGRQAAKAWWLAIGRKHAKNGAGSQSFQFWWAYMRNVYGWNDKTEASIELAKNKSMDELQERMREIQDKIRAKPSSTQMKATIVNGV